MKARCNLKYYFTEKIRAQKSEGNILSAEFWGACQEGYRGSAAACRLRPCLRAAHTSPRLSPWQLLLPGQIRPRGNPQPEQPGARCTAAGALPEVRCLVSSPAAAKYPTKLLSRALKRDDASCHETPYSCSSQRYQLLCGESVSKEA